MCNGKYGSNGHTNWHPLDLCMRKGNEQVVDEEEPVKGLDEERNEGIRYGESGEANIVWRIGPLVTEVHCHMSALFPKKRVLAGAPRVESHLSRYEGTPYRPESGQGRRHDRLVCVVARR